jgi:hypothetical protein
MAAASLLETNGDRRVSDRRGPDQTRHIQLIYSFGCMRLLPVHDFLLTDSIGVRVPDPPASTPKLA